MFPGVITPVPPLNTPVRFAELPAETVAGTAVKLVIVGVAGFTVTVVVWVTVFPVEFVTVRINVVVCVGVTLTAFPLVTERLPGIITPVPPLNTPVRFTEFPAVTVRGLATKLVITGAAGFTVTVVVWETASPVEFVTVRIYVVVCVGVTLTAAPLVTE
jgi:hypothetical protein